MSPNTSTISPTAPSESPQPSYVQSLLDPAVELGGSGSFASEEREAEPTADNGAEAPEEEQVVAAKSETVDNQAALADLIQMFANETGLNPEDPGQRKTLKRLADKELFIRKLQADNEVLKGTAAHPTTDGPDLMTTFEKEQLAAEAEPNGQPGSGQQEAAPAPAAAEYRYNDVGDEWKSPDESLTALNEAWRDGDLQKVQDVEVARLRRNFDQAIAPQLLAFIDKMLSDKFGDVVPEVRRNVAERRLSDSREFAVDQLREAGASDIDQLFVEEDGPPIKFDGAEFPNTPLNRILAQHPEIMTVQGRGKDRDAIEKSTFMARYRLAYRIFRQQAGAVPADAAKRLVEAGAELKAHNANDRARQTINSGSGATGLGEKSSKGGYVNELNNLPGEISFSSLL